MTRKAQVLLEQALKLSPGERAELLDGLVTSLGERDLDFSPGWREEIERRVEGILSGKTKGIPVGKAMSKLRRSLERDRQVRGALRGRSTSHA